MNEIDVATSLLFDGLPPNPLVSSSPSTKQGETMRVLLDEDGIEENSRLISCSSTMVSNMFADPSTNLSNLMTTEIRTIPGAGMEFDSVDEAYNYYNNYGREMGFSVRQRYENICKKDGIITSKALVCNKQGIRGKDKRDHKTKEGRAETRTDCKARMVIKFNRKTEKYNIVDFVAEHNHELHKAVCVHMMKSQRKIGDVHALEVELADDSGITQKMAHEYFGMQYGGRENLGFLRLDQKNYLRTKRQRALQYGEVGCLLGYFQKQILQDPSFVQAVQLDKEEMITNIFWADARMRMDYDLFGEVVTFDTTFSTNKECRPLGVFVGFNHHRQLVFFGATLLYDETSDSFEWLFEKFLEAHNFKKPLTIFTDQDAAMAKALKKVMPETRHALCTWHLMQNAIRHLGNLMKKGSHFLSDLKKLVYEYEDEFEFVKSWNCMLDSYNVRENSWLVKTYKIKEQWGKCYMKTTVTLGMRSTQLSESVNADFKDYLKSNTDITNFFKHFERIVREKRYKEQVAEFGAMEKLPRMKVKILPMQQEAGKVYTPCIFEMFQQEWEKSLATHVKEEMENEDLHEYLIASFVDGREYMVIGEKSSQLVSCDCRLFETFGILCSHALKVLDVMNIRIIPDAYIVKRWTRHAREGSMKIVECSANNQLEQTDRYKELCLEVVKLANFASESQEGYLIMKKAMRETQQQIIEARKKSYSDVCKNVESLDSSMMVLNENENQSFKNLHDAKGLKKKDKVKGGKRRKDWVQMQGQKKRKKICNYVNTQENNKKNEIANVPIQETCQKEIELSPLTYECGISFTQLLLGVDARENEQQS